jgi:hypothetical protein
MQTLSLTDLECVTGGAAQTYDQYAGGLKDSLKQQYKNLVCDGAGLKGGGELASQVYGKGASDGDKIRASQLLTKYCQGGSKLPSAAPAFPF